MRGDTINNPSPEIAKIFSPGTWLNLGQIQLEFAKSRQILHCFLKTAGEGFDEDLSQFSKNFQEGNSGSAPKASNEGRLRWPHFQFAWK
jgi:hypothetical protein